MTVDETNYIHVIKIVDCSTNEGVQYYLDGLNRWEKSVDVQGDHVEEKFKGNCRVSLLGR